MAETIQRTIAEDNATALAAIVPMASPSSSCELFALPMSHQTYRRAGADQRRQAAETFRLVLANHQHAAVGASNPKNGNMAVSVNGDPQ